MRPEAPLLLAASPRSGNTLEAARLFCAGFDRRQGQCSLPMEILLLREYRILPCTACGVCDGPGASCPLAAQDDSQELFARLEATPVLALAAPVYFYHLPAQLKALLDRCQYYHQSAERGEGDDLPRREAFVILLGARERGESLFRGSLLSLRWALNPLRFTLAEPLLLRGLDNPGDLQQREDLRQRVRSYGEIAAERVAGICPAH